jgi:hypothetical protein
MVVSEHGGNPRTNPPKSGPIFLFQSWYNASLPILDRGAQAAALLIFSQPAASRGSALRITDPKNPWLNAPLAVSAQQSPQLKVFSDAQVGILQPGIKQRLPSNKARTSHDVVILCPERKKIIQQKWSDAAERRIRKRRNDLLILAVYTLKTQANAHRYGFRVTIKETLTCAQEIRKPVVVRIKKCHIFAKGSFDSSVPGGSRSRVLLLDKNNSTAESPRDFHSAICGTIIHHDYFPGTAGLLENAPQRPHQG